MIELEQVEFLKGTTVDYFWQFLPWEPASHERAIILGHTAKRIRILHLNADDSGDKLKLVAPKSLALIATTEAS